MPYNARQCRLFGAKSRRGEKVPTDWKTHCKKSAQKRDYKKNGKR
jgi:hypothetical protein